MPTNEARPTQEFVDIKSIDRGVITLKSGALRQILIVSGINFDLKSEEEQQVILSAYQSLLNSLHFSLQFFLHSRRLNIETYLGNLQGRLAAEKNELLRNQISEYIEFIKAFVEKNPIMTKTFFIVVPFDPVVIPGAEGGSFFGFFGAAKTPTEYPEETHAQKEHREQLTQRVNQVTTNLMQIGLRAVPLQDDEIVELFYNLYNPESKERKAQMPNEKFEARSTKHEANSNL